MSKLQIALFWVLAAPAHAFAQASALDVEGGGSSVGTWGIFWLVVAAVMLGTILARLLGGARGPRRPLL